MIIDVRLGRSEQACVLKNRHVEPLQALVYDVVDLAIYEEDKVVKRKRTKQARSLIEFLWQNDLMNATLKAQLFKRMGVK